MKYILTICAVGLALIIGACGTINKEVPFNDRPLMTEQAQKRYLTAMEFMKQGRYELAGRQFAIAAESPDPRLRELALEGQERAETIIKGQR